MRTARAIVALGAIGLVTSSLTAPVQASTYTPDYTCRIPFLAQGTSATVSNTGVTVTATTNSAVVGDTANTYLYQSKGLLHGWVTSDLWCRGVPLEGCLSCRRPIRESSATMSWRLPSAVSLG